MFSYEHSEIFQISLVWKFLLSDLCMTFSDINSNLTHMVRLFNSRFLRINLKQFESHKKLLWKWFFRSIEILYAIVIFCNYQPIYYCSKYPISVNLEQMSLSMPTSSVNKQWKLTISPWVIRNRPYPKIFYLYSLIN